MGIGAVAEYTRSPALPELDEEGPGTGYGNWCVIVYNNEHNTFEEVTTILMRATHCPIEEAIRETEEIHFGGQSVVHHSSQEICEAVAGVIATIGIRVEVREEGT
jgi:ATP-dependent Clp protease adapter protein ClpS